MDIRQGDRTRNTKIILLTSGVIFMLLLLSFYNEPKGKRLKISVGDSSFEVANVLTKEGVAFKSLENNEGISLAYSPTSPLAKLNPKAEGSRYHIIFQDNKVAEILWLARDGKVLASLLHARIALPGPQP